MTDGNSHNLAELQKLTHAREQIARAKLAKIAKTKRDKETLVAELRIKVYHPKTSVEASLVSRWQVWQTAELIKLNTELAAIEANYRKTKIECGRQIAEQAVLSKLVERAKSEESARKSRQQVFTFLGVRYP